MDIFNSNKSICIQSKILKENSATDWDGNSEPNLISLTLPCKIDGVSEITTSGFLNENNDERYTDTFFFFTDSIFILETQGEGIIALDFTSKKAYHIVVGKAPFEDVDCFLNLKSVDGSLRVFLSKESGQVIKRFSAEEILQTFKKGFGPYSNGEVLRKNFYKDFNVSHGERTKRN